MFSTIEPLKGDLAKLAGVLNQFKSEAVQVKLLEMFFGKGVPAAPAVASAAAQAAAAAAPRRKGRPPGSGKAAAAAAAPKPAKAGRKQRGKVGATGALNALLSQGYFKARRTIADVVEACESKVGARIKVTNLSGPLARFVQDGRLSRAKNKDDKFEYWAK